MSQERAMIEARISHEFSKLEAKLAAREKRMREVAEELGNEIRAAESADSPVQPKFNEIAVVRAKAWRAKLLEGIEESAT